MVPQGRRPRCGARKRSKTRKGHRPAWPNGRAPRTQAQSRTTRPPTAASSAEQEDEGRCKLWSATDCAPADAPREGGAALRCAVRFLVGFLILRKVSLPACHDQSAYAAPRDQFELHVIRHLQVRVHEQLLAQQTRSVRGSLRNISLSIYISLSESKLQTLSFSLG